MEIRLAFICHRYQLLARKNLFSNLTAYQVAGVVPIT
jgi:hypothetical protein